MIRQTKYFIAFFSKSLFIVFMLLFFTELGLYFLGYDPGVVVTSPWFEKVEVLTDRDDMYFTDSDGIFKVKPQFAKEVSLQIKTGSTVLHNPNKWADTFGLTYEALALKSNEVTNEFNQTYQNFLSKPASKLTMLEREYINFVDNPINSDGFRSIGFTDYKSKAKKILLIGDSFTWGHTTKFKSSSFSDILLARGYIVFNAGITGADSAQYLAIAKKYIAKLKPDIVIVNFFLGNDVSYYQRKLTPNLPIYFATNAGNLYSFYSGILFKTKELAYAFISRNYQIPKEDTTFNYVMAKFRTTTLIWKILNNANMVTITHSQDINTWDEAAKSKHSKPYSNVELSKIETIAKANSSKLFIVAIPDYLDFPSVRSVDTFYGLFEGVNYFNSPVSMDLYSKSDGHFNEDGHLAYANFLQTLIEKN